MDGWGGRRKVPLPQQQQIIEAALTSRVEAHRAADEDEQRNREIEELKERVRHGKYEENDGENEYKCPPLQHPTPVKPTLTHSFPSMTTSAHSSSM